MSHIDFEKASAERYNHHMLTGGPAQGGITVLDYFAGKALEGISKEIEVESLAAKWCYDMAEAMLAERNKRFSPEGVVQGVTGRSYG